MSYLHKFKSFFCRFEYMVLLITVASGVMARVYSFRSFMKPDGGYYFCNPDSYDHLRHIMLYAGQFPSMALQDSYVGYPHGTGHIWAPLYDYLFAVLTVAFGLNRHGMETLCFYSGPTLYAVSIILLFWIILRLFNCPVAAAAAAFIYTFHPTLLSATVPENFDHHVFELIILLLFIAVPSTVEKNTFRNTRIFLTALLFVAAIFFWRGATIFWGVTFLSVLVRVLADNDKALARTYIKVFMLSSAGLALYCLFDPFGLRRGVSLILISWFHPLILVACAGLLQAVCVVPRRTLIGLSLAVGLAITTALLLTPLGKYGDGMLEALRFMYGVGDPWLSSINELNNTFTTYGIRDAFSYLTLGFVLIPVCGVIILIRWRRCLAPTSSLHVGILMLLVSLAFVYRYATYSSILVALSTAYLITLLTNRLNGWRRRVAIFTLVAVVIFPSLNETFITINRSLTNEIAYGLFGKRGVLTWIRQNTPPTFSYLSSGNDPEYGVLADWDLGSFIYYVAERPALATPFGWETHGFFEYAAFFATAEPRKALAIAAKNRIRYVMTSWNRPQQTYFNIGMAGERRGRLEPGTVVKKFGSMESMYYRLVNQDGAGFFCQDGYRQAIGTMRLIFESDFLASERNFNGVKLSYYKLFEIVAGCTLKGRCAPGQAVSVSLPLFSGRNRSLQYSDMVVADEKGEYSFVVPYATSWRQGETVSAANYLLLVPGMVTKRVTVNEQQVLSGAVIALD